jgi:hypothetical protein
VPRGGLNCQFFEADLRKSEAAKVFPPQRWAGYPHFPRKRYQLPGDFLAIQIANLQSYRRSQTDRNHQPNRSPAASFQLTGPKFIATFTHINRAPDE